MSQASFARSFQIGSFLIESRLGVGSFASVWLGRHIPTRLPVAVKVISKASVDSPTDQVRLQREISFLKSLNHPFISHLFQTLEDAEYHYLVMEHVANGNLLDYVNNQGKLSESQGRSYFTQLVSVLEYLHCEKRIAHRDLKCENLLLDRNKNLKVIDFGLSNSFSADNPVLLSICGSPAYAAPELVLGSAYTMAVDIWSAGVALFAMLVGWLPFDDPVVEHMLHKIAFTEPEYPAFLSPVSVDLLRKMMCKDPERRIRLDAIKRHSWFSQTEYIALCDLVPAPHHGNPDSFPIDRAIIEQMQAAGVDCRNLLSQLINGDSTDLTAHYHVLEREALLVRMHGDGQGLRGLKSPSKFSEHILSRRMSSQRVAPPLPISLLRHRAPPTGNAMPRLTVPRPVGQVEQPIAQVLERPVGVPTGLRRRSRPITIPRCSVNMPADLNTPRNDRRVSDIV
jgi:serine/threonine protein kinase